MDGTRPMTERATDRFIPVHAVAEMLSCTDQYVYGLIREGNLEAIKIGQRALRVSWNSLQEFIAAARVDPEDYFAPEEPDPEPASPRKTVRSNWMSR